MSKEAHIFRTQQRLEIIRVLERIADFTGGLLLVIM